MSLRDSFLKRLFPKAARLAQPRRPPEPPPFQCLGLNREQVEAVLSLQTQPGWLHYCKALEVLGDMQARPLLASPLEYEKYLFQVGVVTAFRGLIDLPDTLSTQLRSYDDHARTRRLDASPDPFTNTPWYDLAARAGRISVRE